MYYTHVSQQEFARYYQCSFENEKVYKIVGKYLPQYTLDEIQTVILLKDGGQLIDRYTFGSAWQGKKTDPYEGRVNNCEPTTKEFVENENFLVIANPGERSVPGVNLFFEPYAHYIAYHRCMLDSQTVYQLRTVIFEGAVDTDIFNSEGFLLASLSELVAEDPAVVKKNSDIIKRVQRCSEISADIFSKETGLKILKNLSSQD